MRLLPSHGLGSASWLRASRSRSPHPVGAHAVDSQATQQQAAAAAQHQSITVPLPFPSEGAALLHHAFTEVPDYSVAALGFIGSIEQARSARFRGLETSMAIFHHEHLLPSLDHTPLQ
jgi:hypothetical protein